jgi:hypothetical protein
MTDTQRFTLICPECREPAVLRPPTIWTPAWGGPPPYSHADGEISLRGHDQYRLPQRGTTAYGDAAMTIDRVYCYLVS